MKKVLIFALCLILTASLTGCGKKETPAPAATQQPEPATEAAAEPAAQTDADWFELSEDRKKITVRVETGITEGLSWSASVTDGEILTMSASDYNPETAVFITEYTPVLTKSGQVEIRLEYGSKAEGKVLKSYTINLTVSETGEMTVQWADSFKNAE